MEVFMKNFRVLHLSDLHIGKTYLDTRSLAYLLLTDLEEAKISDINCVVVTGDIFDGKATDNDKVIDEATTFFNILYKDLSQKATISREDFIFVPGNHDIIWSEEDIRWDKYYNFLKKFYGTIPDFYDLDDFSLVKTYEEFKTAFIGFNSCGLEKRPIIDIDTVRKIEKMEDSFFLKNSISKTNLINALNSQNQNYSYNDFGEISNEQILKVKRKLGECDNYNVVALFHHHFYLFPEVYTKFGDSSLLRNYTSVIQRMQQMGVKTVLHGHKHFDLERPIITDSYYENAKNTIDVFAGGSLGTDRVIRHTFNVIDFHDVDSDTKLTQRKFVRNGGSLDSIVVKRIPPKSCKNQDRIRLFATLEFNNQELYRSYIYNISKINIVSHDYENMVKWFENVFVGFNEVFKHFENDSLCVFFLLISMNYRILKMKETLGKESIDKSYFDILDKLIYDNAKDVDFDIESFIKLFSESSTSKVKDLCDNIFESVKSTKSKSYLAFSMIGVFLTDLYLTFRYYSDNFYNDFITYKVNISINDKEFHQNVPVNKIMIHSDVDRRSAYIDLTCNSATSHKLAVLFTKEFELIISKYEDYFKVVDLKLYYLSPKIEKGEVQNAIDNYNFEAYIPTLIPLLTGDNIYAKKEVFSRELIQNSIDAIAVRASHELDFDKTIYITVDKDTSGREFFKIKDYGTGMDRFKIERYFTSIGRSFYSGDEYKDLDINYKPISNFGIGFLSTFMIGREIDVSTKYYTDEKEGLKLHIPNFDGCFFIEKDENIETGTEITLYIDKKISNHIDVQNIIKYVCNVMLDIKYDIKISNRLSGKDFTIKANSLRRKQSNQDALFVPFFENGSVGKNLDLKKDIWSGTYIEEYPYGLLVSLSPKNDGFKKSVLNSGILLSDADAEQIWSMLLCKKFKYEGIDEIFTFNFPSNYLNVDVSREKVTEFKNSALETTFPEDVIHELVRQLEQLLDLSKLPNNNVSIKASNFQRVVNILLKICHKTKPLDSLYKRLFASKFLPSIRFNDDCLEILISRSCNCPSKAIMFYLENAKIITDKLKDFILKNQILDVQKQNKKLFDKNNIINLLLETPFTNHFLFQRDYHKAMNVEDSLYDSYKENIKSTFNIPENQVEKLLLLIPFIMDTDLNKDDRFHNLSRWLTSGLLNKYTISEIENGDCCIKFTAKEIKEILKTKNKNNSNFYF